MIIRLVLVLLLLATAASANPVEWRSEWPQTDFSRSTVSDWSEVRSGGPPKDGIPAIDDPRFLPASEEDKLVAREPVLVYEPEQGKPRAYPLRYLIWHEIVNDTVAGTPIAVTYCPLCNSGLVFDRRVDGQTKTFGVTGKLRHSDMIMFDRETESWWQQATGTGIVGRHAGDDLRAMPAWMESWAEFTDRNPDGLVLAEPDWRRAYGRNPYVGYDTSSRPFFYDGENPPHGIEPLARVVRVGDRAWPLERLVSKSAIEEAGLRLSWSEGTSSALDASDIAKGREVGSVRVRDESGADVPHDVMFAFAFNAFWPDGQWMLEE